MDSQKTDDRSQRTEVRGQRTEGEKLGRCEGRQELIYVAEID